MSNTASFNLLKFVERDPMLSRNRIFSIALLFVIIILGYYFFQVQQFHHNADKLILLEQNIHQEAQKLQPFLQHGVNNPLKGVLSSNLAKNKQEFYAEFEALSQVQVNGLWLTTVEIKRNPAFIKITGVVDSPNEVDLLLKQLAAQTVFQSVQFVGVNIGEGAFSNIPAKYQQEIKKLKFPTFYHFVIQTTPLNSRRAL